MNLGQGSVWHTNRWINKTRGEYQNIFATELNKLFFISYLFQSIVVDFLSFWFPLSTLSYLLYCTVKMEKKTKKKTSKWTYRKEDNENKKDEKYNISGPFSPLAAALTSTFYRPPFCTSRHYKRAWREINAGRINFWAPVHWIARFFPFDLRVYGGNQRKVNCMYVKKYLFVAWNRLPAQRNLTTHEKR